MLKKIQTDHAPAALGPYSQGIKVENGKNMVFVSGQLPIDPKTGQLVLDSVELMTRLVIEHIVNILKVEGMTLENVVRTDVFLKDLKNDFKAMNAEYAKHFSGPNPPARQTIQPAELPMGSPIEISCIAVK